MVMTSIWIAIGLILGTAFLYYARHLGAKQEKQTIGISLIIAALIYVGFALVWGDSTWLFIELGGVVVYGLFFWLAMRYSYGWLALGWGLHPVWDLALHLYGPGHAVAPEWYTIACLSFDLLVAGYIVVKVRRPYRTKSQEEYVITNIA